MARPTYIEYEERCRRQRATILELQAEIERLKAKVRVHQNVRVALDEHLRTIRLQGDQINALESQVDSCNVAACERLRAVISGLRAAIRDDNGQIVAIGGCGGRAKREKLMCADKEAEDALA